MRFTERGEGIIPVPAHPLASQTLTSLPIIDHLVEDDSGTRIQNLFVGGSVRLAIEVWILTQALKVQANAEVVWSSLYIGAESLDKGSTVPPPPPPGGGGRARCYRSVNSEEWGIGIVFAEPL